MVVGLLEFYILTGTKRRKMKNAPRGCIFVKNLKAIQILKYIDNTIDATKLTPKSRTKTYISCPLEVSL
jgi:hypothetical protein